MTLDQLKNPLNNGNGSKEAENVNLVLDKIIALTRSRFFGKLHLTFVNGKVTHGVEEKSVTF